VRQATGRVWCKNGSGAGVLGASAGPVPLRRPLVWGGSSQMVVGVVCSERQDHPTTIDLYQRAQQDV
jgi:hypothetical protein